MLLATSAHAWAAENSLSASTSLSNEGYFVLNWDPSLVSDAGLLSLEQADSSDFNTVISRQVGAEGATTITGLEDGEYYFRLSRDGNPISQPVQVTVAHHSLTRAGSFFLLGACLFAILIFTIATGNRKTALSSHKTALGEDKTALSADKKGV